MFKNWFVIQYFNVLEGLVRSINPILTDVF